ncbi:hypothetical protein [Sphingobacterium kyonggiense]
MINWKLERLLCSHYTNMLTNCTNNPEALTKALEKLDVKHQNYLKNEGKWLVGGFKSIVSLKPNPDVEGEIQVSVRREVFNMLPANVKADINHCIDLK